MSNDHEPHNNDPPKLWWPDKREDIPPEVYADWPDETSVHDMILFHQRQGLEIDPVQAMQDINALRQLRFRDWQSEEFNRD